MFCFGHYTNTPLFFVVCRNSGTAHTSRAHVNLQDGHCAISRLFRTEKDLSKMSGESNVDESKLTGLSKYFNSQTNTGRANVAKATYATVALIAAYFYLKPKSKK
ncbi:uncharacterized protein LOC124300449 [Neodiprion virginianus]|uniref:uncharacterized protein LOC124178838 n=1 Tax=Neodiprion fabricii TaxID=2872261 RepID=UPI001ED91A29|nr:uncharacterized protein LOC124178838 [Neodiprion fabricii]XP_046610533.1 uncharacterized protein LOC124300449 [Neodiprion virginianus]